MATKKTKKPEPPRFPMVVEGFGDPTWKVSDYSRHDKPSAWNGVIEIRRYRITVEEIEEPIEVYHERLRKLWRECSNYHHTTPIQNAAAKLGLALDWNEKGADVCQRYGCFKLLPAGTGPGYCCATCRSRDGAAIKP